MSSTPAIPVTTVQKITGAINILISLMKASPNGFIAAPASGYSVPRSTPNVMATMTWKYRECSRGLTHRI
jgi:hypothetical protein